MELKAFDTYLFSSMDLATSTFVITLDFLLSCKSCIHMYTIYVTVHLLCVFWKISTKGPIRNDSHSTLVLVATTTRSCAYTSRPEKSGEEGVTD